MMPDNVKIETCSISRQEELKHVAAKFTSFLMQNNFVSNAPISKVRVRELYLMYQEKHPSRIHVTEIISGLYQIHVVKKSLDSVAENPTIQFKSALLRAISKSHGDNDAELSKPRMRIYTNQSYIFRNKAALEPDVVGLHCRLCNEQFLEEAACKRHEDSTEHQLKSLYRNDRNKLKKFLPFLEITGVNASVDVNEKKRYVVTLTNKSQDSAHVEIKNVFVLRNKDEITPSFRVPKTLKKNETFECQLDVSFTKYESHSYPLVILIKNKNTMEIFNVLVEAIFKVIDRSLHDLGSSEPFQHPEKNAIEFIELNHVPGRPLPNVMSTPSYVITLEMYNIPASLNRILNRGFRIDSNSKNDRATLNEIKGLLMDDSKERVLHNIEALNSENYCRRMHHLLWMEEHQMNRDLHYYDQKGTVLSVEKRGPDVFHKLEVPGLSESRPSILRGDEVYVRQANANHKYQGIVHVVEENFAFLALNPKFNYIEGEKVDIEFSLNRITLRICHRAVDFILKNKLISIVFPKEFNQQPRNLKCAFKNPKVELNKEQHRAVNNIVNNTAFPAPYIIYGPPGTGKTSTIVEAIAQIHLNVKNVKICACAPSNAAADLLAIRLLDFVPSSSVYRIYSMSRFVRDIPEKLKKNCNLSQRGTEFPFPKMSDIASKSIVVVTPIVAGRIHGIGGSFYDYVFIDEAGHAEEPLSLIPAVGLLKRTIEGTVGGNLILAGDPKQLGPIIHSRLASYLGLDMSLLERLMIQSNIYKKDPVDDEYDDRVITKLIRNYRSHKILLDVPNRLFYDDELMACADIHKINALCSWTELPKQNFPIIFHGVRGSDETEKNSPSYFNLLELQTVKKYVIDLTTTKIKGTIVQPSDIVVLTPYRKQVQKFRQYFSKLKLNNIEVKSVEEFQGQERKVVIISTVRSQEKFIATDYQFGLGFLRNPKRFNVATTRAQALMIIVGNPDILQTDPCWRTLIEYCLENGGYKGERPREPVCKDLNPNEILTINLSSLSIKTDEMPESERLKIHRYDD